MSTTRLYLIRHGRASAGWDTAVDPELDVLGHQQSREVAQQFASLGPMHVVTSPLMRCQQTAQPLCEMWKTEAEIRHEVAEIPSPEGVPILDRVEWLRLAMVGTWESLGPRYTTFRDELVNFVGQLSVDTVIFSHFVAINAIIGAIDGDDRLVIYRLDNCSVTTIDRDRHGGLKLIQSGREADTLIR
ncbi:MAG: histidine phosphatase family protein [Ilumatobacteraceae bacterium]